MRVPDNLDDDAKKFWKLHAKKLTDAKLLTDADLPNFELLCRNWSLLRKLDPLADSKQAILYMALNKQFLAQSKAFGLTPEARKKLGIDSTTTETDEFGL